MTRALVLDDHPAVRAGLLAVLRSGPGLVPVGAVGTAGDALAAVKQVEPDVALVHYHLKQSDGLALCQRLKSLARPPRVLVYSAFAQNGLTIPAIIAGADALIDKAQPTDDLFAAIRGAARGRTTTPGYHAAVGGGNGRAARHRPPADTRNAD